MLVSYLYLECIVVLMNIEMDLIILFSCSWIFNVNTIERN
jgi:hypothetical protein